MKTAVIYYSYEGNSVLVAEAIRAAIGADIFRIETADKKKRAGLAKYAWGGGQVVMGKKPAILPLEVDAGAYDLIILGAPVWAGSPAPALVSFLGGAGGAKITGKKIAFFCCCAGGKGKFFDKLRALLPGNEVLGEIECVNPAKEDPAALERKIAEWAKALKG